MGYLNGNSSESDHNSFADLLSLIRRRLGQRVSGIVILDPNVHFIDRELIPVIFDNEGSFKRVYHARSGMAWLIRPDGHIAWRCERADSDRLALFFDRIAKT